MLMPVLMLVLILTLLRMAYAYALLMPMLMLMHMLTPLFYAYANACGLCVWPMLVLLLMPMAYANGSCFCSDMAWTIMAWTRPGHLLGAYGSDAAWRLLGHLRLGHRFDLAWTLLAWIPLRHRLDTYSSWTPTGWTRLEHLWLDIYGLDSYGFL